ncbi:hypothetical protein [Synechococcus virus S-ESS1]|uniref:Uncharacterized protein n=1 Tax=Synechococcus virus S-ESS1 TaxID=1964565 RepID=A0A1V0DX12_9CAUD|nr:hypothetical protein JT310_gp16 [Synechococcus virus S-ESS1]ARB05704.1 hypothetical protein [Synechococcus virus S-ESS1]
MGLAEIKATARQALHDFMARPASFYSSSGVLVGPVTARAHAAPKVVGDLAGTNLSYAEVHERPTTIVLWREQIEGVNLRRGCMIIFGADEGWFVDTVKPPDGQTVTVEVSALSDVALAGKVLPDGTVIGA